MALIKIRSIGNDVSIVIDDTDITDHIAAEPRPVVEVAPAGHPGQSRVTVTLVGDLDADLEGIIKAAERFDRRGAL